MSWRERNCVIPQLTRFDSHDNRVWSDLLFFYDYITYLVLIVCEANITAPVHLNELFNSHADLKMTSPVNIYVFLSYDEAVLIN